MFGNNSYLIELDPIHATQPNPTHGSTQPMAMSVLELYTYLDLYIFAVPRSIQRLKQFTISCQWRRNTVDLSSPTEDTFIHSLYEKLAIRESLKIPQCAKSFVALPWKMCVNDNYCCPPYHYTVNEDIYLLLFAVLPITTRSMKIFICYYLHHLCAQKE